MGYVCDQFCLHPFIFQAFLHCRVKSLSDPVNIFSDLSLLSGKLIKRNLILKLTVCNTFQPIQDQLPSSGFSEKIDQSQNIHCHNNRKKNHSAAKYHCPYYKLEETESSEQQSHFNPAGCVFREKINKPSAAFHNLKAKLLEQT